VRDLSGELVKEKDLVLAFAQEASAALEKRGLGVLLTRGSDDFLTLPERSLLANATKARFFASLHMNADVSGRAQGFEVYVLSLTSDDASGRAAVARENQGIPSALDEGIEKAIADLRAQANLEASLSWATMARDSLATSLKPSSSKSVRMGPFYLLYGALMPSVLVELGYLTSPSDRTLMQDPVRRKALAEDFAARIAKKLQRPAS